MDYSPNKKSTIIFLLLLVGMSFLYNYNEILGFRPYSLHQWRQADCLSITMNFYKEGRSFFTPAVHWIGSAGNGNVISEFPLIYYTVAQLWKVFGHHEFIFRLVNMLFFYLGLFHLFKLSREVLKDDFWGTALPVFFFTSPILVYYGNNFIANVPALSCALMGAYYFWRYTQTEKIANLYIFAAIALLGGLLKVTSLLVFFAIGAVQLARIVFPKKLNALNANKWTSLIPFALVLGSIAVWYAYAGWYTSKYNSDIFLHGILPIWELGASKMKDVYIKLMNVLFPQYFNPVATYLVVFLFGASLLFYKKANRFLLACNVLLVLGITAYFILFYQVFDVHDYYLTNLLIFIPATTLTFLEWIKRNHPDFLNSMKVKAIAVVGIGMLLWNTAVKHRIKYRANDPISRYSAVLSDQDRDYWNWYHWDYGNHFKALETITPYLREQGIEREDWVISIPDISINVSLYLMDQKGFTQYGYLKLKGPERTQHFIDQGAKYLIVNNPFWLEEAEIKPFIGNKIGEYKNVQIFDVRGYKQAL